MHVINNTAHGLWLVRFKKHLTKQPRYVWLFAMRNIAPRTRDPPPTATNTVQIEQKSNPTPHLKLPIHLTQPRHN